MLNTTSGITSKLNIIAKLKKLINKRVSFQVQEQLTKQGIISKDTDKKKMAEEIKNFTLSELGIKLKHDIESQVNQEWEENFAKQYEEANSSNLSKQQYVEDRLKKDTKIIEGNYQDALTRLLSENTSLETLVYKI